MILKLLVSGLVVFGAFFAGQTCSNPQDADKKAPSQDDMAKMMKAAEEAGKPGPQHKALTAMVGKWNLAVTMSMPGAPEQKATWTADYKSILGDRFVTMDVSGKMPYPGPDGKMIEAPFNGHEIMGYDNVTKQYQSIWLDAMGTGMFMSTGTADPSGKVITYEGNMKDAFTPQGRPWKMVVTLESEDKHLVEMWDSMDGSALKKVMSIVETRAK
jgi:Protein of unknown function (DUF1579)